MAQEEHNPSNPAAPETGDLTQSLNARANWSKRVLSPWVQRSLQAETGPVTTSGSGQTAFSEKHTRAMVNRIYRQVEEGVVWQPDVGSLSPATFDRFAGNIVERHQPIGSSYAVQAGQEPAEGGGELPLAPGRQVIVASGVSHPRVEPEALPPLPSSFSTSSEPPSPRPPALQRSFAPPQTPTLPPASPLSSPPARPIQRSRNVRIFSRVEEVTPGGKMAGGLETSSPQDMSESRVTPNEPAPEIETEAVAGIPPAALNEASSASPPAAVETQTPSGSVAQRTASEAGQSGEKPPAVQRRQSSEKISAPSQKVSPAPTEVGEQQPAFARQEQQPAPVIQRQVEPDLLDQTPVQTEPAPVKQEGGQAEPVAASSHSPEASPIQRQIESSISDQAPVQPEPAQMEQGGRQAEPVAASSDSAEAPPVQRLVTLEAPPVQRQVESSISDQAPVQPELTKVEQGGGQAEPVTAFSHPSEAPPVQPMTAPERPAVQRHIEPDLPDQAALPLQTKPAATSPGLPETPPVQPQVEPAVSSQPSSPVPQAAPVKTGQPGVSEQVTSEREAVIPPVSPEVTASRPQAPVAQRQVEPDLPMTAPERPVVQRHIEPDLLDQAALPLQTEPAATSPTLPKTTPVQRQVEPVVSSQPSSPVSPAASIKTSQPGVSEQAADQSQAVIPPASPEVTARLPQTTPVQRQVEPGRSDQAPVQSEPAQVEQGGRQGEPVAASPHSPEAPVVQRQVEPDLPHQAPHVQAETITAFPHPSEAPPAQPTTAPERPAIQRHIEPDLSEQTALPIQTKPAQAGQPTPAGQQMGEIEPARPAETSIQRQIDQETSSHLPPHSLSAETAGDEPAHPSAALPVQRQVERPSSERLSADQPTQPVPEQPARPARSPNGGETISSAAPSVQLQVGEGPTPVSLDPAAIEPEQLAAGQVEATPQVADNSKTRAVQRQVEQETPGKIPSPPASISETQSAPEPFRPAELADQGGVLETETPAQAFSPASQTPASDSPPVQRAMDGPLSAKVSPQPEAAQLPLTEAGLPAETESLPSEFISTARQETSPDFESTPTQPQVEYQTTTGLEQAILARTVQRSQLPLNKPRLATGQIEQTSVDGETEGSAGPTMAAAYDRVTLTKPLAQAARLRVPGPQIQTYLEDEAAEPESSGWPSSSEPLAGPGLYRQPALSGAEPSSARAHEAAIQRSKLPLPPVSRPIQAEVQNQGGEMGAEMMAAFQGISVVQRVEGATTVAAPAAAAEAEEGAETEMDKLARQVYPLIKRMLAVERERRSAR